MFLTSSKGCVRGICFVFPEGVQFPDTSFVPNVVPLCNKKTHAVPRQGRLQPVRLMLVPGCRPPSFLPPTGTYIPGHFNYGT